MNETVAPAAMKISAFGRRRFLIASAGASLMFGFARPGAAIADAPAPAMFDPTIWYSIDQNGIVTVSIAMAEMGQHVGTALARIVADELEADWTKVRLDYVDSDPKWGVMVTGGSWSVNHSFAMLSQAGAAGRVTLIAAGAKLMHVREADCAAQNGAVVAGSKVIFYGDIIARGNVSRVFTADELAKLPIKPADDRHLIGFETPAIDIPAKTNGSAVYGIDAEIPGMVFARPKIPPTRLGAIAVSIDDSAAKSVPGYISSLALHDPSDTVPGWVMVFAKTYAAAIRAADLVNVTWTPGPTAGVTEQDILEHGAALIAQPGGGALLVDDPGVAAAFSNAHSILAQNYTTASVLHFQLEPLNALACETDGIFEIHCGNQWQSLILPVLAKALGVGEDKIVLRTYLLGGGFGRRLNGDYTVPAALAAQALGRPVKMVCTRADDARFDSIRSPSVQTLRMAFGAGAKVTAMTHDAAAGWPTQVIAGPALMAKGLNGALYDPFAISGADHWYNVGAHRVRALSNDLANRAFRPGWLRSVGPGWTNWALESFMDEAAHHAGVDPVKFRLALLDGSGTNAGTPPNSVGGALRQANVLKLAAAAGGWGDTMPANTGLGIATTFGQERTMPTWVACVARVSVNRETGLVTLEKLTLVVDAGTIIHPDGALAQVEGGALWGASMALHEGTEIAAGQVADTNLDTYAPLRMGNVPEMDISFVDSTEFPTGLGEPATTVVGPAIGNAIFAASGVRLRHLPIRPEAVRAALATSS
jgi:CO/xanthine dehydrogenase Mo-binding subunit